MLDNTLVTDPINDLMAVFDGIEVIKPVQFNYPLYRLPNYYPWCDMDHPDNSGSTDTEANGLRYHCDWNWLLKIIKRISEITPNYPKEPKDGVFMGYKDRIIIALLAFDFERCYLLCGDYMKAYFKVK